MREVFNAIIKYEIIIALLLAICIMAIIIWECGLDEVFYSVRSWIRRLLKWLGTKE
jgi:hypothetical protein